MQTRTLLAAVTLAVLIVAVTGCGAGAPPSPTAPASAPPVSASPGAASPSAASGKQAGAYTVSLAGAPNPAVRGKNTVDATITDANGQPVTDAKVSFDIDMTNMSHGKNVVVATPAGEGHYWGKVTYMMAGPWRVIVTVERPGQAAASVRFDISVNQR